jgi:hypothetical protein|tara:strand:+ start:31 stop:873 length:843 start_codon:yes stop_codon:yes gene_type:complete
VGLKLKIVEKITNKQFIDYLRNQDKEMGGGDVLKSFEYNIEELENSLERRITNKIDNHDSIPYINIKHFLDRYLNATKFKFVDLSNGLVSCINSRSFSGALTISRTILENVAMLHLKSSEFIKCLENKKYVKLLHELLKMNVRYQKTYRVKDYKRTHINDALRHFNRKLGKDDAFYLYDNISERVHPSPSSFMMYIDTNNKKENRYQNSFSLNSKDIQGFYSFIALTMVDIVLTIQDLYPKIQKDLINYLKDSKLEIDIHFKNNSADNKKHNELINQFNT